MWFIPQYVFINNVSFRSFFSLDFLFSIIFSQNYSRLYQKRYIVGTSIIENFFNVVSWSTIRKWKKVALLAVDLQFGPDECFHFPISKRCEYHNFIFNVKGIANNAVYKCIAYIGINVKILLVIRFFTYNIDVLFWLLEQLIAFTCRLDMNGVVTTTNRYKENIHQRQMSSWGSKKKDNWSLIELNAAALWNDGKMNIDLIFHSFIYMSILIILIPFYGKVTSIQFFLVLVNLHSHRLSERFQFSDKRLLI